MKAKLFRITRSRVSDFLDLRISLNFGADEVRLPDLIARNIDKPGQLERYIEQLRVEKANGNSDGIIYYPGLDWIDVTWQGNASWVASSREYEDEWYGAKIGCDLSYTLLNHINKYVKPITKDSGNFTPRDLVDSLLSKKFTLVMYRSEALNSPMHQIVPRIEVDWDYELATDLERSGYDSGEKEAA